MAELMRRLVCTTFEVMRAKVYPSAILLKFKIMLSHGQSDYILSCGRGGCEEIQKDIRSKPNGNSLGLHL